MMRGSGLAGGDLDFSSLKKGKLKDMLGRPDDYKFTKEELEKINVPEGFENSSLYPFIFYILI